jgi:hypothetical protein
LQPRSQCRAFNAQHRRRPAIILVRFDRVPTQRLQNVSGSHKRGQTFRKSWCRYASSGEANDSDPSSLPFLRFSLTEGRYQKFTSTLFFQRISHASLGQLVESSQSVRPVILACFPSMSDSIADSETGEAGGIQSVPLICVADLRNQVRGANRRTPILRRLIQGSI